jgi:hypothetical protein
MPAGEAYWKPACARCHRDLAVLVRELPSPNDPTGRAELDRFLATHRARDPDARTALINWLMAQERE